MKSGIRGLSALTFALLFGLGGSVVLPALQAQLPETWTLHPIGQASPAGTASYQEASGTFTLTGAGAGLTGTADQFTLLSAPLAGDGWIEARLGTSSGPYVSNAPWGITLRESTAVGSRHVTLALNPGSQLMLMRRWTTDGAMNWGTTVPVNGLSPGIRVKLERRGTLLHAYLWGDTPERWMLLETFPLQLTGTLQAGLLVSSRQAGSLRAASFSEVILQAGPAPGDADGDGLPDAWEQQHFGSNAPAPGADADGDGLTHEQEYRLGTHPTVADTDGDGLPDGAQAPGLLLQELWDDGDWGASLERLIRTPAYPGSPTSWGYLDGAQAPFNRGHQYGRRLRGYFTAPATGDYRFYITGDDETELWLSTTESKFQRRRISQVTQHTESRSWTREAAQDSGPIPLQAGQRHYLEILQKDSNGPDHIALGWQPPGGARGLLPAAHLTAFHLDPGDQDDDDLPDAWEMQHWGHYTQGSKDDPDGDRLTNLQEWRLGGNPLLADARSLPGLLLWQAWKNVPGSTLAELTSLSTYPGQPAETRHLEAFESPYVYDYNYGTRLRAWFFPPESGTFTFYTTGNRETQALFSSTAIPGQRQIIASIPPGEHSERREWGKFLSQRSAPVTLTAGRPVYLELLHKGGGGSLSHAALGWQKDNGPIRVLESPGLRTLDPASPDTDADGWPDDLETLTGTDPQSADPDGDGLPDPADLHPHDYYNGLIPTLTILEGASQTAPVGAFFADALVVEVKDSAGLPLANVPVTFSVTSGGGLLSFANSGAPATFTTTTLRTDAQGTATLENSQTRSLYVLAPSTAGNTVVQAQAGNAAPAAFELNAIDAQPPAAPTNVQAAYTGIGQATITWTPGSGGGSTTGYLIERSTDGGLTWTPIGTTARSATSFTDSTAVRSQNPEYRVTAQGSSGISFPSSSSGNPQTTPGFDSDTDGLTDEEEAEIGTDPENPNTDGDNVPDGQDGWAGGVNADKEKLLAPPRLSLSHFAVVDLGPGNGRFISNEGSAVIQTGTAYKHWKNGEITTIASESENEFTVVDLGPEGEVLCSGELYEEPDPEGDYSQTVGYHRFRSFIWKNGSVTRKLEPGAEGWLDSFLSEIGNPQDTQGYKTLGLWATALASEGQWVGYQYVGWSSYISTELYGYSGSIAASGGAGPINAGQPFTQFATMTGAYYGPKLNSEYLIYSGINPSGRECGTHSKLVGAGAFEDGWSRLDSDLEFKYSAWWDGSVKKPEAQASHVSLHGHVGGVNSEGENVLWLEGDVQKEVPAPGGINTRYQAVSGTRLWQNFAWHELAERTPATQGSEPAWRSVAAYEINDHGVIVGSAIKTETDQQHAVFLLPFEVAIDSDNNNGFDPPRRTQAEREARGELGNDEKPGKVLLLNDGDLDGDGIPDYADGYDLDDGITEDNASENVRFVPVVLNLTALDWQNAKVKFQYPASDPAQVTASADNPCVLPTEGKIRLWKKDGGEERSKDPLEEEGDFIKADTEYTMEQLGLSQEETEVILYVEAVKLSDQTADIEIKVEFDPSGTMGFDQVTDAVRLTATRVEILARGANETNFSASDRLVASTLRLEPGDEQVTLDPFLLVAPIGGGTGDGAETQNGYSLSSQSTGIGGTADQFEMVYYVGNGDFDIHARLASFGNTVATSKAGLMVRDNSGEGAVFGMVAVNGSNNYIFEYRDESAEASQTISGGTAAANPWLRLTRQGGTVRAYSSTDGQSWQQIGNGAALSFAPDSLTGMCLTSGSATTTSTAEFTNVDLPLSSDTLTISDEITPGSYATYKIRIHDPRQSGIDNFKIDDQEVSLTRTGNYYESEELICTIDGERLDVEGIPEKVIYLRSDPPMGEYNPIWPFKSDPKPLPGPNGSRVVADLIDKTVKDMEASGWSGADDGSFGREVHRRVGNSLSNKSGWLVDVYVENGTNRILSVGTSPGGSGYTQVDLLHLKSGYKPKIDDILDSSKIENLFEIKTSLSGSIDRSSGGQLERLKNVNGGRRIVLSKSPKRWTIGGGWQNNKRFGAGFKLLSLVGIGTSVYAILNFDDQDEQLDELIAEGKRINGISDPDWKKAETIVWMGQVRNWLSQFFPDSTVVDLAIVGVIYTKVLPGEEFQTE